MSGAAQNQGSPAPLYDSAGKPACIRAVAIGFVIVTVANSAYVAISIIFNHILVIGLAAAALASCAGA